MFQTLGGTMTWAARGALADRRDDPESFRWLVIAPVRCCHSTTSMDTTDATFSTKAAMTQHLLDLPIEFSPALPPAPQASSISFDASIAAFRDFGQVTRHLTTTARTFDGNEVQ